MALSAPSDRVPSHTRRLEIRGYERADGLWDIEGHLTDTKPFDYYDDDRPRKKDEPIHDMWLRLTIDEDLRVHAAEAHTAAGPYGICAEINPNFAALAGLTIGPGWSRRVRERVGGVHGCTHLMEMLGQMGTTAMQTLWAKQAEAFRARSERIEAPPPGLLDSCYAWRRDGPVIGRKFPAYADGG